MSTIKIIIYTTSSGRAPFITWLEKLDMNTRAIIRTRLDRLTLGNFGDCKVIKNSLGVMELRIAYGPGYRVYYGLQKAAIVIILVGGDKGSQDRDIEKAKQYWLNYKETVNE